jgi:hypothetical protein
VLRSLRCGVPLRKNDLIDQKHRVLSKTFSSIDEDLFASRIGPSMEDVAKIVRTGT